MNTEQFLNQTFRLQEEIDKIDRNIEALRDLATSDTATLSDTPRAPSPSNSRMADIVVEIADLEQEKKTLEERILKARRDIITAARQLNSNENAVIIERYVHLLSWESVCDTLGYSRRQVQRLHKAATGKIMVPSKGKSQK